MALFTRNFVAVLLFLSIQLWGQKEASQWHFAQKCAVNFLTNPPTPVGTSTIIAIEGCASIADSAGNLLMYTNGVQVWNKANAQMPNYIGGQTSSMQSSIIFRKSGRLYYIFTTEANGIGFFGYSIVDMSLAAGMGSVIASYTLSSTVAEKLTATYHCNGSDVWVLCHKIGSDAFEAYLAGPTGVTNTPVISNTGPVYTNTLYSYGGMKFSPNGTKLAVATMQIPPNLTKSIELYDFNNSTGVITNSLLAGTYSNLPMSVEFSPDGSKLYGLCQKPDSIPPPGRKFIQQWDLCAGSPSAIVNSQITVATPTGPARVMQSAIDGKIYFGSSYTSLGCLQFPNLSGALCSASMNVLSLPSPAFSTGYLPNFLTGYFRQKPEFTNTITCGAVNFSPVPFCAGSGNIVNGQKWRFGDPASGVANSSTLSNPGHVFSSNGVYSITLINYYPCFTDSAIRTITVTALPTISVTGKNTICKNESTTFTLSGAGTYSWNSSQISGTVAVTPTSTTAYTVAATGTNSCISSKTVTLVVLPCLAINANEQSARFNVYPNPSNGDLFIECSGCQQATEVLIFEVSGKMVIKEKMPARSPMVIEKDRLLPGIYFYELRHENQKLYSGKFILER